MKTNGKWLLVRSSFLVGKRNRLRTLEINEECDSGGAPGSRGAVTECIMARLQAEMMAALKVWTGRGAAILQEIFWEKIIQALGNSGSVTERKG